MAELKQAMRLERKKTAQMNSQDNTVWENKQHGRVEELSIRLETAQLKDPYYRNNLDTTAQELPEEDASFK